MWIFVLFILSSINLWGQAGLDESVSRDYEEEKLAYILDNLSERHQLYIRYNESLLPNSRYTYSFKNVSMRDVLRILLNDKGLHFREYQPDKVIVVPAEMVDVDSILTSTPSMINNDKLQVVELGGKSQQGKKCKIIGSIIDARDFSPVSSALIINSNTGAYLSSDQGGGFIIEIDTGTYLFQITSISHEPISVSAHIVGSDVWEIILEPKAYLIDEVIISGSTAQDKAKETIIGIEQISRREIKQLTAFMGGADVVKSILSLAGVTTTGDGASGFNVRGGSIDQNLILQDGTIIFNPSHVLGFFSTFNPDIVRNTTLAKGHIPANYGGRISSVLDITIKDANAKTTTVNGSLGLISSKISLETPIIENKSAILFSGRLSYANWILKSAKDVDVKNSKALFNDFNAKYTHSFSEKTKANLSYFQSYDEFSFADAFGYSWQNQVGQLELRHLINDKLSFSWMSSLSSLKNMQFQPEGLFAFELSSGIDYYQHSLQSIFSLGSHTLRGGVEMIDYKMQPERLSPINDSNTIAEEINKERGREYSLFVNDRYDLSERLSVDFGLRYTLYQQHGPYLLNLYNSEHDLSQDEVIGTRQYDGGVVISYSGLEPRVAFRFNLFEGFAIKASYNRMNQYLQLLSNTATPTPVDIWQVSTHYIKPLMADNFSAGIAHSIENFDYNIDIYYKKLSNTLDHVDFADLILNSNLETETLAGRGRNYGAEFSLAKKGEKLSGRFSYSYSRSEHQVYDSQKRTINQGQWFASNYDQPHSVKLFLNYVISRRDRININFVYNTGRPITAPFGNYIVNGVNIPNFSDRNDFRLPDYHRLDIGYTFTTNRRSSARYKSEISISMYNFYARRNAFSIFYRQETGSPINALRLSVIGTIIPSISYNFKF